MLSKKSKYIHLFLLLSISGNPIFTRNKFLLITYGIFLFVRFFVLSKNKEPFLTRDRISFLLVVLSVFILQYFILGFVSVLASLNYLVKIIVGMTLVHILGAYFRKLYLEVIYFLSIISLLFFVINYIGIELPSIYNSGRNRSLVFYNQLITSEGGLLKRNSGMFWEPGVFAGYLTLTFVFYIDNLRFFFISNKRKVIVLLLTLVTTFSTTGYLILFAIILYYLISKSKIKFLTYLSLPIIISAFYLIYTKVDFLQSKIEKQLELSQDRDVKTEFYSDRGSAFLFDLYYIDKHPLIGNGLHSKTRFADHLFLLKNDDSQLFGHGNGFSNFLASMGIPLFIYYLFLYYKKVSFNTKDKLFSILVIIGLLQSEQYLNFPLFLVLPFIHYNHDKKLK